MNEIDEKGFVFLDENNRPFWCRMWGDQAWLFYWHRSNQWVSLRRVSQTDVWTFPRNLADEEQQLYHDTHAKNMPPLGKG